ncbi:ArsR family transcriptional regulator [Hoeflea marina]|uniref:ArsR family transcriptional regulator n=1 Tax=Hoeflea marina TaxID=274592 RepID=A0A317PKP0_9HYPH|nr:metalloregulator ArsR/SmtB family transcription factor [Hoeflea marina]PWW01356.1 ArsR family transcriptional regulator [Hoeflea marina]
MQSAQLDATFSALADPTRRAVLAELASGARTVNELAKPFDISLPAFSRHLKVLEQAGLITRGRDRQFRPCTIAPEPLREATDWMQQYRKLWDERLDRLDAYLAQLQSPTSTEDRDDD